MLEPMSEEHFREMIRANYPEHFRHVYDLHRVAETSIRTYRSFTSNHYQASLSLIFGRAYKSYDSIRRLCEVASSEDAGVLLRSLLNLMGVTRWISGDPAKRAKRYFDWYWVSLKMDADKFPDLIPKAWLPAIQKHYDAVKSEFEYVGKDNKSKFAKQWYQPEAQSIWDLFAQVELTKQYEEAYSTLSAIEHSDINAFFAMTATMEREGTERRIEIQSDLFVPHYLRNVFQYFAEIFRICN